VIERLGGGVEGHWNGPKWLCRLLPDDDWAVDADPLGPNWMRSMLPGRFVLDYFLIVDRVSVDNGLGLHSATNLSGQSRNIYPVQMTDAELAYVARFPQLQHLYLRRTQVGDAGIKHLHKLRHLKQLFLSFTLITDESTETLAQLENLEVLRLVGTQITDEGLFNLKSLKHLQQLDIRDTEVTADGIRAFQANSMLRLNWASAMHSRNSPADD
jgi:hypothetical protein